MALYNFDFHQSFSSVDKLPDHRTDAEKMNSPLSVFNHDNPDIAYAERLAEELVNISGAWIKVYQRTRNQGNRDEVWDEDADPTYLEGKMIKGQFEPAPAEVVLTKWGVDTPNQTTIHFARSTIIREFGDRMISEGDVLIVPHNSMTVVQTTDLREGPSNRMDRYRVIKASDTGNFKYRWLYWSCTVENLLGDITIDVAFDTSSS